jgi:hypothetical protein
MYQDACVNMEAPVKSSIEIYAFFILLAAERAGRAEED